MKANLQDQKRLLELVELDLNIGRNASENGKLQAAGEIQAASEQALALSDRLIDARNRVGDLELELGRAESDLVLVENRITRDKQQLSNTSSAKDAQGIEHELGSLTRRKDELEDAELAIMEALDASRSEQSAAEQAKLAAEGRLAELRQELISRIAELNSKRAQLLAQRSQTLALLDPEVAMAYQRKAERTVAAGRLLGRECGACRLSITATNLEEILSMPADEIVECPNCQAYLVRQ